MAQEDLICVCKYLMESGCKEEDSDLELQDQRIA